jgi:hypothetical protein
MRNAILFLLFMATPALAHDWRRGRAEYWPEVLEARAEYRLNCAEMNAVVEAQRWRANEQALEQFGRVRPFGVIRTRPIGPTMMAP